MTMVSIGQNAKLATGPCVDIEGAMAARGCVDFHIIEIVWCGILYRVLGERRSMRFRGVLDPPIPSGYKHNSVYCALVETRRIKITWKIE